MDWSSRCMIIGGILRGILYLHEDSRLRRANTNPKISDFGMNVWVDDQIQGNTIGIVGTFLYYMHPSYLISWLRISTVDYSFVQEDANNRPTMSSVVHMLKNETISLSRPEKPAFFTGRYVDHHDQVRAQDCSANGLMISIYVPR
ncbi:hypothetical protein DVH24_016065 [Malus domestica]|uniref:Protein kinase domain-containing protein n=1 Tax=Malus domestica TaxID=3750 RepID=A0A498JE74_MALDO|nr:hypothetical protein DVH24_016065 [Malus domestica]